MNYQPNFWEVIQIEKKKIRKTIFHRSLKLFKGKKFNMKSKTIFFPEFIKLPII